MDDLRNNLAKARDEWLKSPQGKQMLEQSIVKDNEKLVYLRNRIAAAFIAGWNAKEKDRV